MDTLRITEKKLVEWTQPLGIREERRCANTIAHIRKAIDSDPILAQKDIEVFEQGSHKNSTNVRLDSDIDVCVVLKERINLDLPRGKVARDYGLSDPSNYSFPKYKNSVASALRRVFGSNYVKRGEKSIKIRPNVTGVNADVVPAFEHRRYTGVGYEYYEGIQFVTDGGKSVVNFPQQHSENGARKNRQTNRFYKKTVRLLKKINYELAEDGYIPSFLVECLVWNVPNKVLSQNSTYTYKLKHVLHHIHSNTKKGNSNLCDDWGEVSELLYLFRGDKGWTKKDAANFAFKAWNYVGFG